MMDKYKCSGCGKDFYAKNGTHLYGAIEHINGHKDIFCPMCFSNMVTATMLKQLLGTSSITIKKMKGFKNGRDTDNKGQVN